MSKSEKNTEKVDFVIIWVDGNDPEWQKEKAKYSPDQGTDSTTARYRDWDNLHYWFRGIEKFTPWVNKIHFVTCGHYPKWLNLQHPKLNFVKHSDYMPEEFLPTFSANPIELNLHRIKGLSENFVFFNDDMFIIDHMKSTDFFKNRLPCDNMGIVPTQPTGDNIFQHIPINDMLIINKYFSKKDVYKKNLKNILNLNNGKYLYSSITCFPYKNLVGFLSTHLPSSFSKSVFEELWKKEYETLYQTSIRKFRSVSDVNQWLFKYWIQASGQFHIRDIKIGKSFALPIKSDILNDAIINQRYKMVCCNDSEENFDFELEKLKLKSSFESILTNKSSFEL